MTQEKLLTVIDIVKELNLGKVTTKFLLKRFNKWMPYDLIDGQPFYPIETIKKLFMIQERLEMGMLPSDIEKKLDASCNSDDPLPPYENLPQHEDIRLSMDGLTLLKSVFSDIGEQQKRIAMAHEKRAAAEERKAVAIEKRAEAEEKKADAMNNIANALQEMNTLRGGDPAVNRIARQASAIIATDQTDKEVFSIEQDNLSLLLDDAEEPDDQMNDAPPCLEAESDQPDDLSLLLDEVSSADDIQTDQSLELDDLSALIDQSDKSMETEPSVELDNLSLLLDNVSPADDIQTGQSLELDDLSALIDQSDNSMKTAPSDQLDDLSKLIAPTYESGQPHLELDDLSLLTEQDPVLKKETDDTVQDKALKMDDLSKLIDDQEINENTSSDDDELDDTPVIKIDISPEKDLKKYKAAIMKIIIELEAEGLDVEATTNRLNKNKIRTLSGNPEWNQKAISQIYKFIRSAK